MNRYITALLVALTATANAQLLQPTPKLVVNITIDQLRTDYIETFAPMYTADGLRKLLQQGRVYDGANYPFIPVDEASAIASIATGTTPYYNSIVATQWLDRSTLRPVFCTDDRRYITSPSRMSTSTIGDEMKVSSNGNALVYAIAPNKVTAVFSAGHAADGALWIDDKGSGLTTSAYYPDKIRNWITAYNKVNNQQLTTVAGRNAFIVKAAKACIKDNALGKDEITDLLAVALSAKPATTSNPKIAAESIYLQLDKLLSDLITDIETTVGKNRVMFVVTSSGYNEEPNIDYAKYRIPTGTFYINRTAKLLNIYLGAIYGQGRYVETCFHNEIYLNRNLIEQKRLNLSDVLSRSQDFLIQNAGVSDVFTSERLLANGNDITKIRNGYNALISGDIIIEVAPGWKLLNEDNQENYVSRSGLIPFPIIIYGLDIKPQRISTPVTVDQIAPTIARTIHIRAPNACKTEPLP